MPESTRNHKSDKVRSRLLRAPQSRSLLRQLVGAVTLLGKGLGILLFLLGAIQTFAYFLPDVSIKPQEVLNASDPETVPFEVTNNGILTLYNVTTWCRFAHSAPNDKATYLTLVNSIAKELKPKEHTTALPCALHSMIPETSGIHIKNPVHVVEIDVSFRPQFAWFNRGVIQAFVAMPDAKGSWHWYPTARSLTDEGK